MKTHDHPPPTKEAAAPAEARTAERNKEHVHNASQRAKSKQQIYTPFVPAWLNQAGLTQPEFRVYCCLASRASNSTGIAWPKAETIASDCLMAKNTVWKSLRSLESKQLIRRVGKPFAGSSRYQVLVPIGANGTPIEGDSIGANGTPIEQSPIGANETPPIGANEILQSAQMDSRECSPKNVLHRMKSNSGKSYSLEADQFASWFKSSLPPETRPTSNWQKVWAKTYDDLVNKDRRPPEEIRAVCKFARTDNFWQSNFQSPTKLRKRNKDGILYYDLFLQKMKRPVGNTAKPQAAVNTELRPAIIEEI